MAASLPAPEVVSCFLDDTFNPPLSATSLRWHDGIGAMLWQLPEDVSLYGPPPRRFGIRVTRVSTDTFEVRVLWDSTRFTWTSLSRMQLLTCALSTVLNAQGNDLRSLLGQPIQTSSRQRLMNQVA